ncbi:SpoIIE family protein phosphatase [Streptomyces sp. NPDC093109]|uniref:SpoIIE family protein phosphatase n=1 Tax=Streptomyces sp. NPDC093109 TaxID=3154977 RepID=UPI00344F4E20
MTRPQAPTGADTASAVIDARGVVARWSDGARALLGYGPAEIVRRPARTLLAGDGSGDGSGGDTGDGSARARVDEALRALDTSSRWSGTATLRHRDGSARDVPLLAHRRTARDGAAEWFVVSRPDRSALGPGADGLDEELLEQSFVQSPCTEGIYDTLLRVRRLSDSMQGLLGLSEDEVRGLRPTEIVPGRVAEDTERQMRRVLETGRPEQLELSARVPGIPDHTRRLFLSLSIAPLRDAAGGIRGVIVAAHDRTRQYLTRQRLLLVNEASSRIGTTLDIGRTAQELADVAVPVLADFVTVDLLPTVSDGGEPLPGPLTGDVTLRRVGAASVLEGCPELVVPLGESGVYPASSPAAEALRTRRPILETVTDPGMARWEKQAPGRAAKMRAFGFHSTMAVALSARGTTLGVATFSRHQRPEPFEQDDLLLAEELTARAAVCVDNARRYTRERGIALALQRSLLPTALPEHAAVEVAFRYLPTDTGAGVGGDWFDVIPLSGSRVALVVGDVVGHGVQASATMGRLRTAVRTLADVDLPPDELLTHLDDLVTHLSAEAEAASEQRQDAERETSGDVGATCLYAVYDPVSRRCSVARAGHPEPAVVSPDGTVTFLDVPAGPPLGLGGLPFEAAEVRLAEGSLLALYTNGLIASRERAPDESLSALRDALARPAAPLEEICDTVLASLLPGRPADDVALLLARTRALGADQVVTWELACDPAIVAEARRNVSAQLAAWGLEEAVFTTELVVSELVTNAIRYGVAPIQLRLIHDGSLICEVSDGSNTAPHLRRARVSDEGGRGLMLVAQLTQSWGTRQGEGGKTIWAEQTLPVEAADLL